MKYLFPYIAAILFLLTSCDEWKWDKNGDLDGMWQMTEWRDNSTGKIIKTNEDGIYYFVQLKLIKFQDNTKDYCHHSYFSHAGDELIIDKTVAYPSDEVSPLTDLAQYGVPADGRFHIDVLNSKHMVLSSPMGTLSFRKY